MINTSSIRFLLIAPLGIALSGVFFVLLAEMVQMDQIKALPEEENLALHLVPLPEESELALRTRDKPKPPEEEPEQPAMPKMPTSTPKVANTPSALNLDVDIPEVQVDSHFQLDVDLSQFQPAEPVVTAAPVSTEISVVNNPMPLKRVDPRYPRKAVRRGIEGQVIVEFTVGPDGEIVEDSIRIVKSEPQGVFDRSSLRALARWRFQPKIVAGKAVSFPARQTLVFKLDK